MVVSCGVGVAVYNWVVADVHLFTVTTRDGAALTDPGWIAEASISKEPGAGKSYAGICAGVAG